ncbi:MAG TPA: nucleotidyltransferase domain-containing protein [Streptosporangiaceae bacterium]|nr:nucleotidyltransferase domain-containing protein [Streptosporangiaceae bacterium]
MSDPDEGMAADGTIRTGARRDRVPAIFEPILTDAIAFLSQPGIPDGASLHVYGSVANGTARPGASDVDLLSIGLPDAPDLGHRLSARYADRCRGVEIATATTADLAGDHDEVYGFRVFLRHYCVHLAGPDQSAGLPAFPADARAARGFNGDIARFLGRWRQELNACPSATDLGIRIARKTLLAVAGLVSVNDHTWTTSRAYAARRWGQIEPGLAVCLTQLHSWAEREQQPVPSQVRDALSDDGIAATIVRRFATLIGLWPDH